MAQVARYYTSERRFRRVYVCRDCGVVVRDRIIHDVFHRRLERLEKGLPLDDPVPVDTSFPQPSPKHLRDLGFEP